MDLKKLLAALLILTLLLGVLPVAVFAEQTQIPVEGPRVETVRSSRARGTPELAPGNHRHYLDRVTSMPDYALEYYRWLEQNTGINGALVDPTKATEQNGEYYHHVTQIVGSETFEFSSRNEIVPSATMFAETAMSREYGIFSAYIDVIHDVFDREHPEVFWLSGRFSSSYSGSWSYSIQGKTCTVTYRADMVVWLQYSGFDIRAQKYLAEGSLEAAIRVRDSAIREILSGCPTGSDYEKVGYLNDALTVRNAYNAAVAEGNSSMADAEAWESISALVGRSGNAGPVCEGYARAFQVLCDQVQIPCVLVNGPAKSSANGPSSGHMWNYVQLDGGWYAVDVTWNDPYVSVRPNDKKSGYENRYWLLVGSETPMYPGLIFKDSHVVTNLVRGNGLAYTNGPVLEPNAYEPHVELRYSISGKITSVGNEAVTVQLWQGSTLKATKTLTGSSAAYAFENVIPGDYQLKVSKAGHVPRSQELTVSDKALTQDLKLHLVGDVTGDGRINVGDVARIYSHAKGTAILTDPYLQLCADITGEGRINVGDTARLYAMIR